MGGTRVYHFMFFAWFNGNAGSGLERVEFAIDTNRALTRLNEENFTHILMGMGGSTLSWCKTGLREIG